MKATCLFIIHLFFSFPLFSQIELNGSYSNNGKGNAHGIGINIGYEVTIYKKIATKSQLGYKKLNANNNFIEGRLRNRIFEVHQTISYKLIDHKRYKFTPNFGLNFRYSDYVMEVNPPYNTLPMRNWNIEFRNRFLSISSFDNRFKDTYQIKNLGFTFQFQNQFKIIDKIWLTVTPFIEDDYDGIQTVAGCYLGIIYFVR